MRLRASAGALFLCSLTAMPARAADIVSARHELIGGQYQAAILDYEKIIHQKPKPGVIAEYAYALAMAGFPDPALAELDAAFIVDYRDPEARLFAGAILRGFGMVKAGDELAKGSPAPAWLQGAALAEPTLFFARDLGKLKGEIASVNLLMSQKRYVSAAVLAWRLIQRYKKEPAPWALYAISLRMMGDYKTAAAAIRMDAQLTGDSKTGPVKLAYAASLDSRPLLRPREQTPPNQLLAGQWLVYAGAGFSKIAGIGTFNINGRVAKFLSNHWDVGADGGLTDNSPNEGTNGANLGLSSRFLEPLGETPLDATLAGRWEYIPGSTASGGGNSFLVSPGISYFRRAGSIDVTLDIGLSGPLKDNFTLTAGYSMFFGK